MQIFDDLINYAATTGDLHWIAFLFVFVYLQLLNSSSWSPNSTDLYFWYLFVELAVVTPVERRNFVSVVPAAKKSKIREAII